MRQPPASTWFWVSILCLVCLTGLRFDLRRRADAAAAQTDRPAPATSPADAFVPLGPAVADLGPAPPAPPARSVTDALGPDDSVYLSLKRHGVPEVEVLRLIQALRPVFDPRSGSRPGDTYSLDLDSTDAVLRFEYTPRATPEMPIVVAPSEDGLAGEQLLLPLVQRTRVAQLSIEDNLSNAVAACGETDALTDLLADEIFGSVVDFHRDPRRGDRIDLVFTKMYKGDTFVRYGQVELARYEGQVVSRTALYYEGEAGGAYYDEQGASLERMFLLKPLSYRRISSGFTRKRYHPILKRNRPHLGTDYAAATGTEVMATARGSVTLAGWNGAYGKMVEIEHPNGYRTRYAHLSRVLVRRGERVDKRQVIGRVGTTGLSTGPHLHYELLRNGLHINPVTVNKGSTGAPLGPGELRAFARRRDLLFEQLAGGPAVLQVAAGDPTPPR